MRVYHFVNARYGLEDLEKKRLKVARIHELNDPFEFLGADLSDHRIRQGLRNTKRGLSEEHGILCFAKSWRSPVLWTHYADRHRGLCLGFDVPRKFLKRVGYLEERFQAPSEPSLEFVQKLLYTKFAHWAYEQELRSFVNLETEVDGKYFMSFSTTLKLRRVIVGSESVVTRKEVADALGDAIVGVEVFKARPAYRTFEVVRNRDESQWA